MPFKDLRHPPIQLGILQQCLARADIRSRAYSLELAFMEYLRAQPEPLSVEDYQDIALDQFVVQLGDWVFRPPSASDDDYLDYIRRDGTPEKVIASAIRMKALVPGFLQAAAAEVLAERPRVVGFSTVFQQNVACLELAKTIKDLDPSLVIVFGGDNCDGVMGAALHKAFPFIDVVCRGEGERVLVELVQDVLADRPIRPQPGLCYRVGGEPVAIPMEDRPLLAMTEVPSPLYDDYFDRLDASPLRADVRPDVTILFESSRGCWWGAKSHCTFCGLNGSTMMFRSKPAARVAEEVLDLARRYRILKFVAVDDIIDLAHVRELLPMLRDSGCDLDLFYETKANLTKEQLRLFCAAGVRAIQPGIESLSTPILRLMRKGVTELQNIRLLKWCAELGISVDWNLLSGFPGEPPEEYARMAEVIPSLVHLEAPKFTPIQVQRFSPYFERPAEFGLELTGPMPYYRYLYDVSEELLADIVYDYGHRYVDGRTPATYTTATEEAVHAWRRAHRQGPGTLRYRRGPGFLLIEDRRAGLDHADYHFDDTEAEIYLACDAGATPETIRAQLTGDDLPDAAEIEAYLNELVAARLLVREDRRFLSLAIPANALTESSTIPQPAATDAAMT
jgi:ribosomal peptide maturation radical SAM protein 1